jgi:hypothetical protein
LVRTVAVSVYGKDRMAYRSPKARERW